MKKKRIAVLGMLLSACVLFAGCSGKNGEQSSADTGTKAAVTEHAEKKEESKSELPDGVYKADFTTDSSMFHVNETCEGKGTLTVENGEMTIHVSLVSKKIVKLYQGLAEDAQKEGAELLSPTEDTVTYSDGLTEDVYGFDIPVPVLNQEFDVALLGEKGTWYDHKVKVSNPEPFKDETVQNDSVKELADGIYTVELSFEGGSGKAKLSSPVTVNVSKGTVTAAVEWNSPNYDYMIVDGEKYLPVNTGGNSVFEIPVLYFDKPMNVIGDTVAMSKPHEIEYTLTFHSDTMKPQKQEE